MTKKTKTIDFNSVAEAGGHFVVVSPELRTTFKPMSVDRALPAKPRFARVMPYKGPHFPYYVNFYDGKEWVKGYSYAVPNMKLRRIESLAEARARKVWNNFCRKDPTIFLPQSLDVTFGSDPELFVVDEKDKVIPAWEFLPSKKNNPVAYWDGFQAEFRTDIATCLAYHVDYIREGMLAVYHKAIKHNAKAKLSIDSVVDVPIETLLNEEDEHVVLGCDPSFNAYGNSGQNPGDGRDLSFRFAGGHIHIGTAKRSKAEFEEIIKAMDATIGVASVGLFASFDKPVRRAFYGLAGEYRLPPHGVEYRVLSNAWLMHPAIAHLTFDFARAGARLGAAGLLKSGIEGYSEERIQDIINGLDVKAAKAYLKENKDFFTAMLKVCYPANTDVAAKRAMTAFNEGAETVVKDPKDLVKNWSLTGKEWQMHSERKDAQWCRKAKE